MAIRGIRGAITISEDEKENVLSATRELLGAILAANHELKTGDIASALFTTTEEISSAYPALAARQMGWDLVPMICAREIPVPGGLPMCVRVLIHWNTNKEQDEIQHVYLREAVRLRPDLVSKEKGEEYP